MRKKNLPSRVEREKNSPVPLVVENAKHHAAKDQHHLPRSSASFFSRERSTEGEENLESSFRASERRGEKEERATRSRNDTERDSTIRRGVQCTRPLDG